MKMLPFLVLMLFLLAGFVTAQDRMESVGFVKDGRGGFFEVPSFTRLSVGEYDASGGRGSVGSISNLRSSAGVLTFGIDTTNVTVSRLGYRNVSLDDRRNITSYDGRFVNGSAQWLASASTREVLFKKGYSYPPLTVYNYKGRTYTGFSINLSKGEVLDFEYAVRTTLPGAVHFSFIANNSQYFMDFDPTVEETLSFNKTMSSTGCLGGSCNVQGGTSSDQNLVDGFTSCGDALTCDWLGVSDTGQSAVVDLNATFNITRIEVFDSGHSAYDREPTQYEINYSLDNATWTTLFLIADDDTLAPTMADAAQNNRSYFVNANFTPFSARYLMIWNITGESGNEPSVSEFSVYGNTTAFGDTSVDVYDETFNQQFWPYDVVNNETVTLEFIGASVFNTTTNNGSFNLAQLTPGFYEVRYDAPSFDKRSYFFTADLEGGDIRLYLLNTSVSQQVTVTIVDENDNPLNGSILKVQRFYAADNAFQTVEMARANFNGEAVINIVPNSQEYRFLVDSPLGTNIFNSNTETKVTSTTLRIQVLLTSGRLKFAQNLEDVATSLTKTGSGQNVTYVYTFSDANNFLASGCLRVEKQLGGENELLCESCTTASTGTLSCNVNFTSGTLVGYGLINTTNPHQIVTDLLSHVINAGFDTFGGYGVFLSVIAFLGITGIAIVNLPAGIILAILSLVFSTVAGIFYVSVAALASLLIGGLIIAWKAKS